MGRLFRGSAHSAIGPYKMIAEYVILSIVIIWMMICIVGIVYAIKVSPMSEITPGQAAYETWRTTVRAVATGNADQMKQVADYLDSITPPWNEVSDHVKAAWQAIAESAITAYEDPMGLGPIARDMEPEELERFKQGIMHSMCADRCGPECSTPAQIHYVD